MRRTLLIASLLLLLVPGVSGGANRTPGGQKATTAGAAAGSQRRPTAGAATRSKTTRAPRAAASKPAVDVGKTRTATTGKTRKTTPAKTCSARCLAAKSRKDAAKVKRIAMRTKPRARKLSKAKDTRAQQRKIKSEPLAKPPFKPDFVGIGMGPTGMMAILAAIATGHTAVGVEIRQEPLRGVHQNIRVDWFHTLDRIDKMMLERYGPEGVPKLPNGEPFILADYFYNPERVGGAKDFPEIFGVGEAQNQNIAGRLDRISFEDAREQTVKEHGGKAPLYVLPPPPLPTKADRTKLNPDMKKVLDSPSTFQAAVINYELMLRAYLTAIEKQDAATGRKPRFKLYASHRVAKLDGLAAGYMNARGDKRRIVIEEVSEERGAGGKAVRGRKPGTQRIDLGVPTRFSLTTGFGGGGDAETLGYEQDDVVYDDPSTGESVVAQQNWLVGEVTANIGGQLIRRISTITDPKTGKKQTIRQIAVGHERAPNVAWVPVQVPDFMTFDPVEAGRVPRGTSPRSKKYVQAREALIREYFVEQVSAVTHIPARDIDRMRMFYGPNFFTLREKLGKTARVAANGNVAGDLMGNGHFLTSGGAMTGMIGHGNRYITYFEALKAGVPESRAARALERGIRQDSEDWLRVSIKEFFDVSPVNFGEERARAIGIKKDATAIADARKANKAFGLEDVLGQRSWARAFDRLRAGEFGKANRDFYVPKREVDLKTNPDLKVQDIGLGAVSAAP